MEDGADNILNSFLRDTLEHAKAVGVSGRDGCYKCNYRTYTLDENNKVVMCDCWYDKIFRKQCQQANVPVQYIGMTLDNDWNCRQDANNADVPVDVKRKTKIKNQIATYTKHIVPITAGLPLNIKNSSTKIRNLMLIGESQSGKTLLAVVIAQEAIKKGLVTTFINWTDIEPIFSDFDARDEQNQMVELCKNSDVVIIDGVQDLGVNNPYYLNGLERIANARTNSGGITVVTAYDNFSNIRGKHNWTNLVESCYKIHLPSAKVKRAL
jgi:DNA replication protein DnaC